MPRQTHDRVALNCLALSGPARLRGEGFSARFRLEVERRILQGKPVPWRRSFNRFAPPSPWYCAYVTLRVDPLVAWT